MTNSLSAKYSQESIPNLWQITTGWELSITITRHSYHEQTWLYAFLSPQKIQLYMKQSILAICKKFYSAKLKPSWIDNTSHHNTCMSTLLLYTVLYWMSGILHTRNMKYSWLCDFTCLICICNNPSIVSPLKTTKDVFLCKCNSSTKCLPWIRFTFAIISIHKNTYLTVILFINTCHLLRVKYIINITWGIR